MSSIPEELVTRSEIAMAVVEPPKRREITMEDIKGMARAQAETLMSKAEVRGTGLVTAPPFTPACLVAIKQRADAITDQIIKTDLFRLILEVERLQQGG